MIFNIFFNLVKNHFIKPDHPYNDPYGKRPPFSAKTAEYIEEGNVYPLVRDEMNFTTPFIYIQIYLWSNASCLEFLRFNRKYWQRRTDIELKICSSLAKERRSIAESRSTFIYYFNLIAAATHLVFLGVRFVSGTVAENGFGVHLSLMIFHLGLVALHCFPYYRALFREAISEARFVWYHKITESIHQEELSWIKMFPSEDPLAISPIEDVGL